MNPSTDTKSLAAHVLVALVRAQRARQVVTVHDVAIELDVRKTDVRDVVARLHHEGHVDALRMKVTLSGLTLATALASSSLRPLRSSERADSAAA